MIREFENICDITFAEFNSPELNESFHAHNDEQILLDSDGRIGFKLTVIPSKTDAPAKETTIWGESFGDVLNKYDIIVGTAIMNITTMFFEPSANPVIIAFYREYKMKIPPEKQCENDECCGIYYQKVFQNAKTAEEIVESFSNFEDNTTE